VVARASLVGRFRSAPCFGARRRLARTAGSTDDADRTIAETGQYLDDAHALLRTENTAVDFFNAKIERYPNHLGRTVLWAGCERALRCARTPRGDIGQIILTACL
jgi:hypothetical protein